MNIHVAILFMFFFLTINFNCQCQNNLVVNGSFEDTIACPWSNDLNNGQLELAKGWWKPTLGTSDFFHRCNDDIVGVPNNFWGYQEPFHGDAYVGFSPAEWFIQNNNYAGFEYIQTRLLYPLKPCYVYSFSMHISLAEGSEYSYSRIGAFFSRDEISSNNSGFLDLKPQVLNDSGWLSDTNEWIDLSGNFVANGGEEFLTIGYFFPNVKNDTLFIHETAFTLTSLGYYYADSISVVEIGIDSSCEVIFPNTFSPNNDNVNDYFSIEHLSGLSGNYEVKILNRWGEVVSVLNKDNELWNGESNMGKDCPEGVYYFTYEFEFNGEERFGSGYIHLFR